MVSRKFLSRTQKLLSYLRCGSLCKRGSGGNRQGSVTRADELI